MSKLNERPFEQLDYIGVSYGLTAPLLKYVTNVYLYDFLLLGFGKEPDLYRYTCVRLQLVYDRVNTYLLLV